MQIAAVMPVAPSRAAVPTADVNFALLTTSPIQSDGSYTVDTASGGFDPADRSGGFITHTVYSPDGYARMNAQRRPGGAAERVAALAIRDAILGTGLLQLAVVRPEDGWIGMPDPGMTRLYLDRRSAYVEYRTDAPPAAMTPVLAAIEAWKRVRTATLAA